MPILIKRPNGKETPLVNGEYLSAYYFFPKEMLDNLSQEFSVIPREPMKAVMQKESRELIESDLFLLLIIDGFSWLVWPFMGIKDKKEIYSGYEPAWKLSHNPDFWIKELIDREIIPDSVTLLKEHGNDSVGYMTDNEIEIIMEKVVPAVMEKYNMYEVIKTAKEYRCFEDFDYRHSSQKVDFHRKWYHSRSKVGTMLSLDSLVEDDEDGVIGDNNASFEDGVIGEDYYQRFKSRLSEKDMRILELRMLGFTYDEIAKELGYKNHSGVFKRMRAIKKEFLKYEQQL